MTENEKREPFMHPEYRAYMKIADTMQNACNFVAVVNSFAEHVTACWRAGVWQDNGAGVACDAATIAILDKLWDMAGRPNATAVGHAHGAVFNANQSQG